MNPSLKKYYENPIQLRYGNLVMKNVLILVILLLSIGAYWKRRNVKNPMKVSGNVNVVTLSQTVSLLSLFSFDNTLLSFVISTDNFLGLSNELVFNLEMLRVLFIENIFFKFFVPLYLLKNSRTNLPLLWAERTFRKADFFMTAPSFIPRRNLSRYQPENVQQPEQKVPTGNMSSSSNRHVIYVRHSGVDIPIDFPNIEVH